MDKETGFREKHINTSEKKAESSEREKIENSKSRMNVRRGICEEWSQLEFREKCVFIACCNFI